MDSQSDMYDTSQEGWAEELDIVGQAAPAAEPAELPGKRGERIKTEPTKRPMRRPRYRRVTADYLPPLRLNDRDVAIMKLVHDYRLMTSRHIELLVEGSGQNVLRRLGKLYQHGYLARPVEEQNRRMIYALDNRGADELAKRRFIERRRINWPDKNRDLAEGFVAHTLMVSDFRALLTAALRAVPDITLHSWTPEGELRHDVAIDGLGEHKVVVPLIPDGSFILERPRPSGGKPFQNHIFLEADRSTMSGKTKFYAKMKAYWVFWQEGLYQNIYGRARFQVHVLTLSPQRRDNLRVITQRISDKPDDEHLARWRFACVDDYTLDDPASFLRPIWLSARQGDEKLYGLLE